MISCHARPIVEPCSARVTRDFLIPSVINDRLFIALKKPHNILCVEDGRVLRTLGSWDMNHYLYPVTWSPDGRFVALTHITGHNGYDGYFSIHEVGATWTEDDVNR